MGHQPAVGHPTGAQPVLPVAPVVPIDPNALGYQDGRGGAPGGPRNVMPTPNPGLQQMPGPVGAGQAGPQLPPQAQQVAQMQPIPGAPQTPASPLPLMGQQVPGNPQQARMEQQVPSAPQAPMVQQAPLGQQEMGGQSGPIGLVNPSVGYSGGPQDGGAAGISLADAVQSAHEEGQAFGESVARDAPALWLEAVLARKPRMPSDLEARLLQGSALPIDFLLHDEVRHALRRGFWDALERTRR